VSLATNAWAVSVDEAYDEDGYDEEVYEEEAQEPVELPDQRLRPRLVDEADVLTDSEESELLSKLDEISGRQQMDVVIATVNSLEGKTAEAYADDYFDYNGFGYGPMNSGILLLVSMEDRDWAISTSGDGITAFTDAGCDYIGEEIVFWLSDDLYEHAFLTFADNCDKFVTQARTGEPYDGDFMPEAEFEPFWTLAICLVIAFIISLIITGVMKAQLKSVRSQTRASQYVRTGSLNVTCANDFFLYRTLTRVPRPKESSSSGSSTHRSSSGRTHGGRSGKF
jgi:uncharacterized protein